MAEKVKVSRVVANVLDELRGCHGPTIDDFIERHTKGEVGPDWQVLKQYRTLVVAHLIYTGDYEIEETPEEILLHEYQEGLRIGAGHRTHANAIKFTLDTLGIKIKGINE